MTPAYRYRAEVVRVIDADTFVMRIDLGFHCAVTVNVRLRGIDTPELRTAEGEMAKTVVIGWFSAAGSIVVETYKDQQSFARWIADVWLDGLSLADRLRTAGLVKKVEDS